MIQSHIENEEFTDYTHRTLHLLDTYVGVFHLRGSYVIIIKEIVVYKKAIN